MKDDQPQTKPCPETGGGPLSGVRALCFEHMMQGPLASLLLSGLGAEVIKIEPINGSVERRLTGRGQWIRGRTVLDLVVNRGKRSVAINLKDPRARDILDRLLANADIVTHNYRPGVMERFGLGFDEIHAHHPHIVYGAASGYGEDGPYREKPGQDLLIQAMTGMMYINGRAGDPPTPLGSTMVDVHSGTLLALAVCAGMVKRQRSGVGSKVAVDLLAAGMHLQMEPLHYALNSDEAIERPREGLADPYHHAPYGVYATTDGHLAISTNDMEKLAGCLAKVEPIKVSFDMESPETFAQRDEIYRRIAAVIRQRPSEDWMEIFRSAGVWAQPVRPAGDAIRDDEQVRWREMIETVGSEAPVKALRIPVEASSEGHRDWYAAPYTGQDSVSILRDLQCSDDYIRELTEDGVIGASTQEAN